MIAALSLSKKKYAVDYDGPKRTKGGGVDCRVIIDPQCKIQYIIKDSMVYGWGTKGLSGPTTKK